MPERFRPRRLVASPELAGDLVRAAHPGAYSLLDADSLLSGARTWWVRAEPREPPVLVGWSWPVRRRSPDGEQWVRVARWPRTSGG